MDHFWQDPLYRPAFEFARATTRHHAKSFYFASRLLPRERRWSTYALYGFCRYTDNLVDLPRGRSRDQLLHEIEYLRGEMQLGYELGESEHPVLKPFIRTALYFAVPIQYPLDLLQGIEMDIRFRGYENFDELYLFCYRVAGVVGLMMTHILGYNSDQAFPYAEKLGVAMQLTNILRDIDEDGCMGRVYLPREELARFNIDEKQVLEKRWSPDFRRLMEFQVARAHSYYDAAAKGIPMLAPASRFAIYSASRIYRQILIKIAGNEYNPFLGRVFVPALQKLAILLREKLIARRPVL